MTIQRLQTRSFPSSPHLFPLSFPLPSTHTFPSTLSPLTLTYTFHSLFFSSLLTLTSFAFSSLSPHSYFYLSFISPLSPCPFPSPVTHISNLTSYFLFPPTSVLPSSLLLFPLSLPLSPQLIFLLLPLPPTFTFSSPLLPPPLLFPLPFSLTPDSPPLACALTHFPSPHSLPILPSLPPLSSSPFPSLFLFFPSFPYLLPPSLLRHLPSLLSCLSLFLLTIFPSTSPSPSPSRSAPSVLPSFPFPPSHLLLPSTPSPFLSVPFSSYHPFLPSLYLTS